MVNCDTGKSAAELAASLPDQAKAYFNFENDLSDDWFVKKGINDEVQLKDRLQRFTSWLEQQPGTLRFTHNSNVMGAQIIVMLRLSGVVIVVEERIAIVAHHNVFLGMLGVSFLNCEVREYCLEKGEYTPVMPEISQVRQ